MEDYHMKQRRLSIYVLGIGLIIFAPILSYAQSGNTVSGFVFGTQRQPISDATVELSDDYSRSIGRTRTNASGRYIFSRISSGRFRIRVLSLGLDYEEQEQDIEIQNFSTSNGSGGITTSGYENVQKDFYLKLRKDKQSTGRSESVFVQEIPLEAKEIYKKAIALLDGEKSDRGLKELKAAIESFPDYYDAIERLGTEYVKLHHYVPAQILLQRAVEINPGGYKSWYGLSYALYSQNKISQAIEAVEKANSLNQFSIECPLLNGVLLRKAGKYEQSEKQLKKAKDLSKGSVPEVHWQLAILYGTSLNRYREAANELKLFLKISPNNKDSENIKKLIKQYEDKSQEKTQK